MKYVALAAFVSILAVVLIISSTAQPRATAPVYSTTTLRTAMLRHPREWVGRVVWVRGIFVSRFQLGEGDIRYGLAHLGAPIGQVDLWLRPQPANDFYVALRRIPLLDALLAPHYIGQVNYDPTTGHYYQGAGELGSSHIYRIQLQDIRSCTQQPCPDALLVNVTP